MDVRTEWPDEERIDQIGRNRTEDDLGHYDKVQSTSCSEDTANAPTGEEATCLS